MGVTSQLITGGHHFVSTYKETSTSIEKNMKNHERSPKSSHPTAIGYGPPKKNTICW
jgi:hypothetical protein